MLRSLPRGLIPLYQRMLSEVLDNDNPELVVIALNILRAVVVSFRTLTLIELGVAASLPAEFREDTPKIRGCVLQCGSFLQYKSQLVKFFLFTNQPSIF